MRAVALSPVGGDAHRGPCAARVLGAQGCLVLDLRVVHGAPVGGVLQPCFALVAARDSAEGVHGAEGDDDP